MMQADTKKNFFRQSGWMMACNLAFGVFMAAAAFTAANVTPATDYSVFVAILRLFVLVTLPAAGIQTLLAQQTAAAISEQAQRDLAATARGLLKLTIGFWIFLVVIGAIFQTQIVGMLQASNPHILWAVLALILGAFLLPLFVGLMQGAQNFLVFGWATILNGFGRFVAILAGIKFFDISATGATVGAFLGYLTGVLAAIKPSMPFFRKTGGNFDRAKFFRRVLILTAGAGSTLFIINVDMLLVQSHFEKEFSTLYAAAETIGIAVVTLCTPVAAVMFPKVVRSRATASTSDALTLAIAGTAIIGGAAALFCTIFPELPLRILYFKRPEMLNAAPLIAWFMWAMVPLTMYNVLVNNLIGRERYGIIPFTVILPVAYTITLYFFLQNNTLAPMDAFKRVIQILMGFSTALLAVSVYFSLRASREETVENRSAPRAATP